MNSIPGLLRINRHTWLLVVLGVLFVTDLKSQNSLLNLKITLHIKEKPVEWVLREIEQQFPLHFSFNSNILPEKTVDLNCDKLPLAKVLEQVFGKGYLFKSTGSHVIILKRIEKERDPVIQSEILLTGVVLEGTSQRKVAGATVWSMEHMESVLSDSNGRFLLNIRRRTSSLAVRCSKIGYRDTLILLDLQHQKELTFKLFQSTPAPERLQILSSPGIPLRVIPPDPIEARLVGTQQILNSRNSVVYDHMPAQLSLIPNISTNLKMCGAVTNNFSVNVLGGYSAGVSGLEVGGLINITRQKVAGLQVCGGINQGPDTLIGMQAAGFANLGIHSVSGIQFAGVFNYTKGPVKGAQLAGLFNYAKKPGFQLAVINVGDTCSGSPLGIINIIRHGYYSIVLQSDEAGNFSLLGNTGTYHLYNRFGVSKYGSISDKAWALSYGFGKQFRSGHVISWSTELFSSVIGPNGVFDSLTLSKVTFDFKLNLRLSRHLVLMAGPQVYSLIGSSDNPYLISQLDKAKDWQLSSYSPRRTRFDNYWGLTAGLSYVF